MLSCAVPYTMHVKTMTEEVVMLLRGDHANDYYKNVCCAMYNYDDDCEVADDFFAEFFFL